MVDAERPREGIDYNGPGGQFSASDRSVSTVMASAERMWASTLKWSSDNPFEFSLVMIVIIFLIYQRRVTKVQQARYMREYGDLRERVRSKSDNPDARIPPSPNKIDDQRSK